MWSSVAADTELFVQVIGDQKHSDGTKLLFDFLQQPRLNKQVKNLRDAINNNNNIVNK